MAKRGMAKRGMQPDDFYLLRTVTDPRLSPDGTQVAFVVSSNVREEDEAQTAIWVAPADGSSPARQFTKGPKDSSPRWSPDGRSLAFVSRRGKPDEPAQIHVASLDGGDPLPVTDAPHGASQPAWSPDGARLAYIAPVGEWTPPSARTPVEKNAPVVVTDLRYRFDGIGWFDSRRAHVFTVEIADTRTKQITTGNYDHAQPAWSPDGARLAFASDRTADRFDRPRPDVWTAASTGGKATRITDGAGSYGAPEFSPDGRWLSYLGSEGEDGNSAVNAHLFVAPVAGGGHRSVSAPLDRPVSGLVWPTGRTHCWVGDAVYFLATDRGAQHVFRAEGTGQPEKVVGGERQVIGIDVRGTTVAFASLWPSTLPEARVVDTATGKETTISDVNAELRKLIRLVPTKRVRTGKIESFVISEAPKGTASPTVLEIHGGPHGFHPQSVFLPLYQCLASAGFTVLLPNPRGSHSYGEAFAHGCVGDWGGGDFEDLMGALDALVDSGSADRERLYVSGYSYGGFMTGWTVGHTDRFKGACISAPVSDMHAMANSTDIPDFLSFELGGGNRWERHDTYTDRSPIAYLPHVHTPVRLFHWEGDIRCPIAQSEAWFQGLKLLGRDVQMIRYPGGFHIVRAPSQMVDYVERHLAFFSDD